MVNSDGLFLLDYGAGNVRSLVNAVNSIGFELELIKGPEDFKRAKKIIFPGVGNFGNAMRKLHQFGYYQPLKQYIQQGGQFLGICVGMQCLFNGSEESQPISPEDLNLTKGLGLIDATVSLFKPTTKAVPHMGWNRSDVKQDGVMGISPDQWYYFVHSYKVDDLKHISDNVVASTRYGDEQFVSAVKFNNAIGIQFHPEKSGKAGLELLESFLSGVIKVIDSNPSKREENGNGLSKRIVACLDIRADDDGELVVTKGDQYDVREKAGNVRNLGRPVDLATKYYLDGADEIVFLNIKAYNKCPLQDQPMLELLKLASQTLFVPLTIGGGIKEFIQPDNTTISAEDVAGVYFRSGADKVSIGSDAVITSENYYRNGKVLDGKSTIERISKSYGAQAVVVSIDPKRCYVTSIESAPTHTVIPTTTPGPNGEQFCWFQCTTQGGRKNHDLDVIQLTKACTHMGAGEFMVNSIDMDGTKQGYDLELINLIKKNTSLPVIASSGAGKLEHFQTAFMDPSGPDACLAAGIFHRDEVTIPQLKQFLSQVDLPIRPAATS